MKKKITLGIESSCDETAAAIYHSEKGLLSNELFSQVEAHRLNGGVIPEIASRFHMEQIILMVEEALSKAKVSFDEVDNVAVTSNPGLPGSLMIGVAFAKALAWAGKKNIIGINHLEGHIFSACIENNIPFPFLALTVSGGHTALYLVKNFGLFEMLGQTQDDAAGEAFDKVAQMMNLPYPGGPVIEKLAEKMNFKDFFHYPRGKQRLDFSFSGLKTAVLYNLVKQKAYDLSKKQFLKGDDQVLQAQVASSFLVCVGDIFQQKVTQAIEQNRNIQALAFVGGVACNKYLRRRLQKSCERFGITFYVPQPKICTDNAAMIAFVGNYKADQGRYSQIDLSILQ